MASDFSAMLGRVIRIGQLQVVDADGSVVTYGDGTGRPLRIRLADDAVGSEIAADPALKLGEAYMDGRLVVEEGDVFELLSLLRRNGIRRAATPGLKAKSVLRLLAYQVSARVPVNRNRRNVAHHYDLDARLFDLFLDHDWQYSCAYFEPRGISLDEAQTAKKRHITAKLLLQPGQRVLEVGSGWGGLGMYMAESSGVDVTGITLSEEQLAVSRVRVAGRGLSDRVRFELTDYVDLKGEFDRIVSVGMFEHVGLANYGRFFKTMARVLKKEGVFVLHYIGRVKPARAINPWIEKYIFPGGYLPALSEVLPSIERAGFLVKDIEMLPMHYAWTLKAWRERFVARWDDAARLYDERFCRMWEFYLAAMEAAFRHDRLPIIQLQLARHQDAVPYARDYIGEAETRLRAFEAARPPLDPVQF
ncbi:cyclopropane-fatty-acyl-phospholipid synthase family protein [Rhizobium sp. TRM96647]|uniref:SAM-dependent methyltransferase n=1 Tax=unclassified Rhizobium TaxID=2613769 RepID=UPI0021E945AB|nr:MULTISPECIES: cyclopropane-fatty-acyl-phospholipid synthase family protein [unclassified Rhizobium]MCV3738519.1 cyclopropane-fatty-acyl-phospholipid synthase family protein [Rhizobium sp. TRM96647]MCV3760206.1 cyclopropane-fatty-acyl-phospholipid synthase family protein [Rhizobium sp. TRM96650]